MAEPARNETAQSVSAPGHHGHGGLLRKLVGQFGKPSGLLGRLVGRIMARKNRAQNEFSVEVLGVQPTDRILEIGFGHGVGIEMIAEKASDGYVAGIDHSDAMLEQASGRNRRFIDKGTVELREGSVSELPFPYGHFDKAITVNCFHHWPDAELGLREVRRVLAHGGVLVIGERTELSPPKKFSAPGLSEERIKQIEGLLREAGFLNVKTERRDVGREVICIVAIESGQLLR